MNGMATVPLDTKPIDYGQEKITDVSSMASTSNPRVIIVTPLHQWQKEAMQSLFHLHSLPHDWDSYGSPPPLKLAIEVARKCIEGVKLDDIPIPQIVPVPGGGVQLEWNGDTREVEIEILPNGSIQCLMIENDVPLREESITIDKIRNLILWMIHAPSRAD